MSDEKRNNGYDSYKTDNTYKADDRFNMDNRYAVNDNFQRDYNEMYGNGNSYQSNNDMYGSSNNYTNYPVQQNESERKPNRKVNFEYNTDKLTVKSYITKKEWKFLGCLGIAVVFLVFASILNFVTIIAGINHRPESNGAFMGAVVGLMLISSAVFLFRKTKRTLARFVIMIPFALGLFFICMDLQVLFGIKYNISQWIFLISYSVFFIYEGIREAVMPWITDSKKRKNCDTPVRATVIDYKIKSAKNGKKGKFLEKPVFEYNYTGYLYRTEYDRWLYNTNFNKGTTVDLMINRMNPNEVFYFDKSDYISSVIKNIPLIVAGLCLLVLSVIKCFNIL